MSNNRFSFLPYDMVSFDVEVYPDIWTMVAFNHSTAEWKTFVVWEDEGDEGFNPVRQWLNNKRYMSGHNASRYDHPVLAYIFHKEDVTTRKLKAFSNFIIEVKDKEKRLPRYKNAYKVYKSVRYANCPWEVVDTQSIVQRITQRPNLKKVGVHMGHHRLQELPLPHNEDIGTAENAEILVGYNRNDVEIQVDLTNLLAPEIQLRYNLGVHYGMDMMSSSDSNLTDKMFHGEAAHMDYQIHPATDPIKKVNLRDVIPGYIHFKDPLLVSILQLAKSTVLYPGYLNDNGDIQYDGESEFKMTFTYRGLTITLAKGGIHSVDQPRLIVSIEGEFEIWDWDVTSYYPFLAIQLDRFPRHLQLEIVKAIYQGMIERRSGPDGWKKKIGKVPEALSWSNGLKIALNGYSGKLNYPYGDFNDPFAYYGITVPGQLLIIMAAEMFQDAGIQSISCNTDGITVGIKPEQRPAMVKVMEDWMNMTGLNMEPAKYHIFAQEHINSYVAKAEEFDIVDGELVTKGKIKTKTKGAFVDPRGETPTFRFAKGYDKPIVANALVNYFMEGVPIEDTIRGSKDLNDFASIGKISGATGLLTKPIAENATVDIIDHTQVKVTDCELTPGQWIMIGNGGPNKSAMSGVVQDDGETVVLDFDLITLHRLGTMDKPNAKFEKWLTSAEKRIAKHELEIDQTALAIQMCASSRVMWVPNGHDILSMEVLPQDTNRWVVTNSGSYLMRQRDDYGAIGSVSKMAGELCTVINDLDDSVMDDLNYDYYIRETQKIIDKIEKHTYETPIDSTPSDIFGLSDDEGELRFKIARSAKPQLTKIDRTDKVGFADFNKSFVNQSVTVGELVNMTQQGFATAPEMDGPRSNDSFKSGQILYLDFDDVTYDTIVGNGFVEKYGTILHSTLSHVPGEKERWRVMFVMDVPVLDPHLFNDAQSALLSRFTEADQVTKDPGRFYYGSNPEGIVEVIGNFLPQSVMLSMVSEYNRRLISQSRLAGEQRLRIDRHLIPIPPEDVTRAQIWKEVEPLWNNVVNAAQGTVHDALVRNAITAGGYVSSGYLSEDQVVTIFVDALKQNGGDHIDFRNDETTIRWCVSKSKRGGEPLYIYREMTPEEKVDEVSDAFERGYLEGYVDGVDDTRKALEEGNRAKLCQLFEVDDSYLDDLGVKLTREVDDYGEILEETIAWPMGQNHDAPLNIMYEHQVQGIEYYIQDSCPPYQIGNRDAKVAVVLKTPRLAIEAWRLNPQMDVLFIGLPVGCVDLDEVGLWEDFRIVYCDTSIANRLTSVPRSVKLKALSIDSLDVLPYIIA